MENQLQEQSVEVIQPVEETLQQQAVRRAIQIGGGPSKVARGLGINQPHSVGKWVELGRVPPYRVIPLERLVNGAVTRHELDPVLYPIEQR